MPGLWSGSITFGLVSIPVRLEVSQRRRNLGFNLLHQDCLQRINQKYHCSSCETDLERGELVKGYEYEKDRYTVVDPADFEAADGDASRHIEVVAFVEHSDLRPEHQNRTYYLVPEEGSEKSYVLLLQAMQETNRVALARFIMRGKEYVSAVVPAEGGLMLHILFHQGEFKHITDVVHLPSVELKEKELDLVRQIVENLTEEFSEDLLVDEYRERLLEIIRAKVEGEGVTTIHQRKPAKVIDLMDALKRSLEATAPKRPAARMQSQARPARVKARAGAAKHN